MTVSAHSRWCCAVSRGRKPSPAGVIYVCLTLERTRVEPSVECLMIPAPNLLADPSSPRAIYGLSVLSCQQRIMLSPYFQLTWSLQRRTFLYSARHGVFGVRVLRGNVAGSSWSASRADLDARSLNLIGSRAQNLRQSHSDRVSVPQNHRGAPSLHSQHHRHLPLHHGQAIPLAPLREEAV